MATQHNNIKPIHTNLINMGASSTHSTLTNFYVTGNRAFNNLTATNTVSTHGTLKNSGYQYLTVSLLASSADTENLPISDSFANTITNYVTEIVPAVDSFNSGSTSQQESAPASDVFTSNIINYVTETGIINDSGISNLAYEEDLTGNDSIVNYITNYISDYVQANDGEVSAAIFSFTDSVVISVVEPISLVDTTKIMFPVYSFEEYSTNINITAYQLQGVTSIYSPASSFLPPASSILPAPTVATPTYYNYVPVNPPPYIPNPFQPTIISGTNVITSHSSTYPSGYTPTAGSQFVQYETAAIGNTDFCQLLSFNSTIDYTGGNWSAVSIHPIGNSPAYADNLGQELTVLGLRGSIVGFGQTMTNSAMGYATTGIYGNILLNKTLDLLCGTNSYLLGLLTNNNTIPYATVNVEKNPQDSQAFTTYTTYNSAAQAIAKLAGISLAWNIPDFPLVTLALQEGDTGLSALSSLVGQCGGTLRWDGYYSYTACYPNYYSGSFVVPTPNLLTGQGISDQYLLDLESDSFGVGLRYIPTMKLLDPTNNPLLNGIRTSVEPVYQLGSIRKPFTASDPPQTFPLPQDASAAKIQIVVNANQTFSGAQYVTSDPSVWFDLGTPSLTNPYVKINTGLGQAYAPYINIDSTLFPNLGAINNGNFVMNLGYVRTSQAQGYENAKIMRESQLYNLQLQTLGKFKYVKAYEGNINCVFFGALPLPGMWASATYCGYTVQGIIESVSFSAPGILNIQVAQYATIDWVNNYINVYPSLTIQQ